MPKIGHLCFPIAFFGHFQYTRTDQERIPHSPSGGDFHGKVWKDFSFGNRFYCRNICIDSIFPVCCFCCADLRRSIWIRHRKKSIGSRLASLLPPSHMRWFFVSFYEIYSKKGLTYIYIFFMIILRTIQVTIFLYIQSITYRVVFIVDLYRENRGNEKSEIFIAISFAKKGRIVVVSVTCRNGLLSRKTFD